LISCVCLLTAAHGTRAIEESDLGQAANRVEMVPSGHMVSQTAGDKAANDLLTPEDDEPASLVDLTGPTSDIAAFPPYNQEEALNNPAKGLARDNGKLKELPELFTHLSKLYKNMAHTVWEGGDSRNTNVIQAAGTKWVDASRSFDKQAGDMKDKAKEAYEKMVQVHNVVGKEAMDTFYKEIIKLKETIKAHEHIAVDAKTLNDKSAADKLEEASKGGGAHQGLSVLPGKNEHQDKK